MNIQDRLAEPFLPGEVQFRAGATTRDKSRALALGYVDARTVMYRLDNVVGMDGWYDHYCQLGEGGVLCELSVRVSAAGETPAEWITKCDVGAMSAQQDPGDKIKAAVSDALKRAAIKFGIGRYLYDLPQVWVDYDQNKQQLKQDPQLPDWALPWITSEQAQELSPLLAQTNSLAGFLAHYKIQKLERLPANRFAEAKERLLAKKAAK